MSKSILIVALWAAHAASGAITYPGHADTADRLVVYGRVIDHPGGEVVYKTRAANAWSFTAATTPAQAQVVSVGITTNQVADYDLIEQTTVTGNSVEVSYQIQQRRKVEAVTVVAPTAIVNGTQVTATANGEVLVELRSPSYSAFVVFQGAVSTVTVQTDELPDAGSAWKSVHDEALIYLPDAVPTTTTLDAFSPYYPEFGTAILSQGDLLRNPSCWLAGFDLTAISMWNSEGKNRRRGTAISPRHVLFATHYTVAPGEKIYFLTAANELVTRTITALTAVPDSEDITIALLDSDLPTTISPMKTLGADWTTYFPAGILDLPVIVMDQDATYRMSAGADYGERGLGFDTLVFAPSMSLAGNRFQYHYPTFTAVPGYEGWQSATQDGDSGNPAFIIIAGEPVLLCSLWFSTGGPSTAAYATQINATMESLSPGGYQLTHPDLSGFNTYP